MKQDPRKYAANLLDRLVELDKETTAAYYEMGQILYSFREGRLWEQLEYDSMAHLIEEELTFTDSTANAYIALYSDLKRLHYNKPEALALLEEFGITNLRHAIAELKQKSGKRAIRNKINNFDMHQINFALTSDELLFVQEILCQFGAEIKQHRTMHASQALVQALTALTQRKAA